MAEAAITALTQTLEVMSKQLTQIDAKQEIQRGIQVETNSRLEKYAAASALANQHVLNEIQLIKLQSCPRDKGSIVGIVDGRIEARKSFIADVADERIHLNNAKVWPSFKKNIHFLITVAMFLIALYAVFNSQPTS